MSELMFPRSVFPMSPSLEHLLAKLSWLRSELDIVKLRCAGNAYQLGIVDRCSQRLEAANIALNPPKLYNRRRIFGAWDLLHQIDADLVLLMNRPELLASGRQLLSELKSTPVAEYLRSDWLMALNDHIKSLHNNSISADELDEARYAFREITSILDSHMDNRFWELWCSKLFSMLYTSQLLLLLSAFIVMLLTCSQLIIDVPLAALLGAMGGLGSGILTQLPLYIPYGHFWVSFWYFFFIRIVQGAFAAIMVLWMLQAQYYIAIYPSVDECMPVFGCNSSGRAAKTSYLAAHSKTPTTSKPTEDKQITFPIKTTKERAPYLYLLILMIAGFAGDKILKNITSRLNDKLFATAEKTKEVKPS